MDEEGKRRIKEFAEVAREYVAWVDAESLGIPDDMRRCRELLCDLHRAVIRLPEVEPKTSELGQRREEWYKTARARFSSWPIEYYWEIFDPLAQPLGREAKKDADEPVVGSISDDLADIYREIREGLEQLNAGRLQDACWTWRFHFEFHFGHHIIDAQRALHAFFSNTYLET